MAEHTLSILIKAIGASAASKEIKSLSQGIGGIGGVARKGEAALQHFGGRLGMLAGATGIVGVTGAALGFAGALEQGISKADDMALAVEKLSGVTGMGAHEASQYVAVFQKFNLAGDDTVRIAGFAEKALGKLAASHSKGVSKLVALDKQYGLSLVDTQGKVVDFGTELGQVADYYNSSASASDKAALASQLFGRNYVQLIPILKLGSKGIAEVAAEADKLGLTLKSAQDVTNVKNFIAAQRDAKDAIGGLEVQLGLLVMPDLTGALKGLTGFIAGHRGEIQDFFKQGLRTAEGLGQFVTGTLVPDLTSVGGALLGAWNSIPAPLRDMIVKGAVADRTVKFLFGFSPIHTIVDVAESSISKALGAIIGKNIVQPVFVTNQVPGGGLPGVPGAAGAGVGAASIVSAVIAIPAAILIANALKDAAGITDAQQQFLNTHGQFGPRSSSNVPAGQTTNFSALMNANAREDRNALHADLGVLGGKITDDIHGATDIFRGAAAEFKGAAQAIAHAKGTAAVAKAAEAITKLIGKGRGTADSTAHVLESLKKQLANTHDPKLEASLRADIHKVEGLLPGRQFAAKELAAERDLLNSGKTSNKKIVGLQEIMQALKDRGLPKAAAGIQADINHLKTASVNATHADTAALRAKKMSVTTVTKFDAEFSLYNKVIVSGRTVTAEQLREHRVGTSSVSSSASAGQ